MTTKVTRRTTLSTVACLLAGLGQQGNVHAQSAVRLTPAEFQTRAAELISERVQITGELRGTTLHDPRGSAQVRISLDRAPAATTRWLSDNGCRTRCSGVTLTGQVVVMPSTGRPALMVSSASWPAAGNTGKAATVAPLPATAAAAAAPTARAAAKAEPATTKPGTNIATPGYRDALNQQLTPDTREGRGPFRRVNASGWAGTWSTDCQRHGAPRIHLLRNGLVFEHGERRVLSNAQYSTRSTFGEPPPKGFQVEYGGDAFAVYLYREERTLYLTLGEADENLRNEFIKGGPSQFTACSDVASSGPEPDGATRGRSPALVLMPVNDAVLAERDSGLQWTRRDNGRGISHAEAIQYCETLKTAGAGWRLPEIDELTQLVTPHKPGDNGKTPCGTYRHRDFDEPLNCHISALFAISGPTFWSSDFSESSNDSAFMKNFFIAFRPYTNQTTYPEGAHALCVRNSQ